MYIWCSSVARICTWICNMRKDAIQVRKKSASLSCYWRLREFSDEFLQLTEVMSYRILPCHHRDHTECASDAFRINSASRHDATLHNTRPHLRNKTRPPRVCDDRACSLNAIWHPTLPKTGTFVFLKFHFLNRVFAVFWICVHGCVHDV